ncbi:MAG TPA: hypothetical protein VFB58_12495 [Chloroflexota bacterium]|nr:hypothetical protein [Chloroflexota bacterium]
MRWPAVLLALLLMPSFAAAASPHYAPRISGSVADFRLAGIEPDGDPLDQVLLQTTLAPSAGMPRLHLIVDTYLENFQPDTTPVLPDLLHPNQTAQNLGGFLQGKALVADDAGKVLYLGTFIAEAFLNNSNHMVLSAPGQGMARGGEIAIKGTFTLRKNASLRGALTGRVVLPAGARRAIARDQGAKFPPVRTLLSGVTVHPHAMMGRNTQSHQVPLHTGYGPRSHRSISPVTIVTAAGAVVCFLLAVVLWRRQRDPVPKSE